MPKPFPKVRLLYGFCSELSKLFSFWVIMHSAFFLLKYPTTTTSKNKPFSKPSECQRVLTAASYTCIGYELDIALKLFTNPTKPDIKYACAFTRCFLLALAVYIGTQHSWICKDYMPNSTLNVLEIVKTLGGS